MFLVALTGGIGSGKTTVSERFKSKSVPIIDTDIIARQIVEQGKAAYQETIKHFGKEILNTDKSINRKSLREIIFSSESKRLELENILHPLIWDEVALQISSMDSSYCIVVVPLLVENINKEKPIKFNRVLVVDTTEELQLKRSMQRDNSDSTIIKKIMESQVSRQTRLDAADDIIINIDDLNTLNKDIEKLHKQYLQLSKQISQNSSNS